jgi:hypothetical protein
MRILLEKVMLDLPGVVDAEPVGELHLVEGLLVELQLAALAPRPRQLVLVEDSELHPFAPSIAPENSRIRRANASTVEPTGRI